MVDQMAEQEAWDSSFAIIPGEDEDVGVDSGYWSGDEPSKPLTKDEKDAIKILEETCVRYARKHLSNYFTDPKWKQANLIFPSGENQDDRLVRKNWLGDDEIELEYWMKTFAERIHDIPKDKHIFQAVWDLRNAAVHRGVPGTRDDGNPFDPFSFKDLSQAVQFPHLLGDSKAHEEISHALRCVMEDPTLDDETKAATEKELHTPQPCTTRYQFLARIQTMLEETCFNTAARRIPDVLKRNDWRCHEQLEITKYDDLFYRYNILGHNDVFSSQPAGDNVSNIQGQNDVFSSQPADDNTVSLSSLLNTARIHTRNVAHHRLDTTDGLLTDHGKLVKQTHNAITLCVLQGDWNQAIEIEILAEMFLTKTSREQVLDRLGKVYRIGKVENAYERRRRVEIRDFLAKELVRDVEEGEEDDEDGKEVVVHRKEVEKSERWKTWSPSMHGELLRWEEMVVREGFEEEVEGGKVDWVIV